MLARFYEKKSKPVIVVAILVATIIALQLVVGAVFEFRSYASYSLSYDSSLYFQASFLVAHQQLDPYLSVAGFHMLGNHGEFILWILGVLGMFNNIYLLLLEQVIAISLCELIVFLIVVEKLKNRELKISREFFGLLAVVLIIFNPWVIWSEAGDFHLEPTFCFLLLSFYYLIVKDSSVSYVAFFGILLSGNVAILWFLALVIGLLVTKGIPRKKWLLGYLFLAILWWFLILVIIGDKSETISQGYSYLAINKHPSTLSILEGLILRPNLLLKNIIGFSEDLYANLFSASFVGVLSPIGLITTLVLSVINLGSTYRHGVFAQPGFAWLLMYTVVPIETVVILARLRFKELAVSLLGIIFFVVGFFASVIPTLPSYFTTVNAKTAKVLNSVRLKQPIRVISQGVSGRFSDYKAVFLLRKPTTFNLNAPSEFLVVPYSGVETLSTFQSLEVLQYLASNNQCRLTYLSAGVFISKCNTLGMFNPFLNNQVAVFGAETQTGVRDTNGPASTWSIYQSSTNPAGYLLYGINQNLGIGTYYFTVTGISQGPLSIQVWDDTTNQELAQQILTSQEPYQKVTTNIYFRIQKTEPKVPKIGKLIFFAQFAKASNKDLIELRIYSPGGFFSKINSIGFEKVS